MKTKWDRVIFAALISIACYGANVFWYRLSEKKETATVDRQPVAFVTQSKNDVQRRPVSRQIWNELLAGDPVFSGEAVRTSADAQAKLHLADGGRTIELEPETLIIISQTNKDVALDLMDGRLFVAQTENQGAIQLPTLTLKSGATQMDLSTANAKLSKGSGERVDIEVLKGSAKVKSGDKVQVISTGKKGTLGVSTEFDPALLQILSPADGSTHSLDPEQREGVRFAWKGLPAGSEVRVELGPTRKELKPWSDWVPAAKNEILLRLGAGTHKWRVVARKKGTPAPFVDSNVAWLKVVEVEPAKDLSPESGVLIQMKKQAEEVAFSWKRPAGSHADLIEIATDSAFEKIIQKMNLTEGSKSTMALTSGAYYWRVVSSFEGRTKGVTSEIHSLNLQAPALRLELAWVGLKANDRFTYTGTPKLRLAWKADRPELVQKYKIKISNSSEALRAPAESNLAVVSETKESSVTQDLKKPGRYWAQIEAFGSNNRLLASTPALPVTLELKPLLAAPHFLPEEGDFESDTTGKIDMKWDFVEGAKEYWLTLKDQMGQELQKSKYLGVTATLMNLIPGDYQIGIYAVDSADRKSRELPTRHIHVPDLSGLAAPKLRKVQVK